MTSTATLIAALIFILAAVTHALHVEVPVDLHFVADTIADGLHVRHLAHLGH